MTLSGIEKSEIIDYVNDNLEGNSVCDDEGSEHVVFTFDRKEDITVGTSNVLELLKRGFFILYVTINDEGNFEMAITNGEGYRE